jgi:hypothetical protein
VTGLYTLRRGDAQPVSVIGQPRRLVHSLLLPWGAAAAITGAAWGVRAVGITTDYNIFIDETTYTRIADNLATGRGLTLFGSPFDLHPPAGFAMMALAIRVFSMHGSLAAVLFDLRPFVALGGALTCALVFILVGRTTGWRAGLVVATITAADPFQIYYDSRVMLEAPAQLATTGSIVLLAAAIRQQAERRSWALTAAAGVAAGLALCVKENYGLVLAGTLILAIAAGRVIERKKAALALVIMICCYLLSQLLVVLTSGLGPWWDQVGSGARRLAGVQQTTGFNSATVHVSLTSRLDANVTHFGITYLILGLGAVAGGCQVIGAVRHWAQWRQPATPGARGELLVALWATAAAGYLAYATAFGTLEEQMYYVLFVPALCTLVIGCRRAAPRLGRYWRQIAAAIAVVVVLADGAVWASVHSARDDEYRQLLSWAPRHLPNGTTVAVTEDTAQFLLLGGKLGQWGTVPALIAHHVDYVLLSTALVAQGYGIGTPQFERYLEAHAKVVWEATGPSSGALILFDVRPITGAR